MKKQAKQTKQAKKKVKKRKKEKLKMLPSLREKRHYLVLMVQGKAAVIKEDIKTRINDAIINFIGILGYAKAGPLFIESGKKETSKNKTNNKTNKTSKQIYFILSVTTKYVDAVKAAITLIKKPVIRCIGVSGTLKKSKRFL